MLGEKVKVVLIMLAKMCSEIPQGYSKSIDKIRAELNARSLPDVQQFMD
jgi:hypothetical protein